MAFRTAVEADEATILDLWMEAGLIHADLLESYRADLRAKMAFQPEFVFLAEVDGTLEGTVMAGYDGRRGWINCLAVVPASRNKGLGSELVALAERHLIDLGCRKINLQVRSSNTGVLAFYEKLGYTRDQVISLGKRTVVG